MVRKRAPFPVAGELVVGQAETIERMYVYVRLEDYQGINSDGKRAVGMIHISELANRWIRNVSNYIKLNQRVVLKVLRINEDKGHIDLSLRRVNSEQKISRMNEWKYEVKAENLLRIFSEKIGMDLDEAFEKAGYPLSDEFGELHDAFDDIKENGISVLDSIPELDLTEEQKKDLYELIDENTQLHQIEIEGVFEIVLYEGNGIEIIKDAIKAAKSIKHDQYVSFDFHYVGAPTYNFKLSARDYPEAEKLLKKVITTIEKKVKPYNGYIDFLRH
ncbi:MAG: S1 RNA-binding domain-containing protein [archaeon]|nr:S1 RNA-binding domain-containing protein [archaeon]